MLKKWIFIIIFTVFVCTFGCLTTNKLSTKPDSYSQDSIVVEEVNKENYSYDTIYVTAKPSSDKVSSPITSTKKTASKKKSLKKKIVTEPQAPPIAKGNIIYNIPDTMTYDKVETVILRITQTNEIEMISSGFRYPERSILIKNIRVSPLMTAELIDPSPEKSNFIIKEINTKEQNIETEGYTEWQWTIKPIKSGTHGLKLLIKVRTDNGLKDIPVFDKDIYVYAKPSAWIVDFWNKYWQWIMSTVLIPIFVFLYKKFSNHKKNPPVDF